MNVKKIAILISITILIGGSFYFFEYAPKKIQKDCSDNLLAWSVRANDSDLYNKYFKQCINSGGYQEFKAIVESNREVKEEVKKEPQPALIQTIPSSN